MNIVEFALKFKDMASTDLHKFSNQARSTFTQAKSFAENLTGQNKAVGQSYNEIQRQIKAVENTLRSSNVPSQIKAARKELADLQKQASKHPSKLGAKDESGSAGAMGLGALSRFAAPAALLAIGYKAAEGIGTAINKGLERQTIETSFSVLTGSEESGKALSKQLVDLQKNTILGGEVFQNAQTMLGFGFKDTEVLSNMKMLGDVSMGNADKLGSLTLAFSQVRAAGKMQGQDMLQFVTAGFNPLDQIAKSTGKSFEQLKDEMAAGNISFEMVQQAFKDATSEGGKFNGMLDKIAQTDAGKAAALDGAINELVVNFGKAMMPLKSLATDIGVAMLPMVEELLPPLTSGIKWFVGMLREAKPYFVEMLAPAVNFIRKITADTSGWMGYLTSIKEVFVNSIYPFIKKISEVIWDVVGQIIEFVKNSEILKDVFGLIAWTVGKVFDVVGWIVDKWKWLFDNVIMPMYKVMDDIYKWIKGVDGTEVKIKTVNTQTEEEKKQDKANTEVLKEIERASKETKTASKDAESTIASGGPRTINISVQKFFDNLNINSANLPEAVNDVEGKFLEMFARILVQGATSA